MSSMDEEGRCDSWHEDVNADEDGSDEAAGDKSSGSRDAERKTTDTPLASLDQETERVESRVLLRVRSSIRVSITSPGVRLVCRARTTNLGRQLMTGMRRRENPNCGVCMACCITQ